jgi:hypothetical protein
VFGLGKEESFRGAAGPREGAYVSIRQHTSAYVSLEKEESFRGAADATQMDDVLEWLARIVREYTGAQV